MRLTFALLFFFVVRGSIARDFFSTAQSTETNLYRVDKKSIIVVLFPSVHYEIPEGDSFRLLTAPFKDRRRTVHQCVLDPGSVVRIYKKEKDIMYALVTYSSDKGPTFHPCQKEEKKIKITKEEFNMWREGGYLNLLEN
jgi:hypothetical protein